MIDLDVIRLVAMDNIAASNITRPRRLEKRINKGGRIFAS